MADTTREPQHNKQKKHDSRYWHKRSVANRSE